MILISYFIIEYIINILKITSLVIFIKRIIM